MNWTPGKRVPLGVLYGFLQEAADMHATSLGFDSGTMLRKNLVWMLVRVHLRLEGGLVDRQVIEVDTWPSKVESRFAYRDYRIYREEEAKPFGAATSTWILIDLSRNRPAVVTGLFAPEYHLGADRAHELPAPPMGTAGPEISGRTFPVRRSDIDLNGHVNNLHYVEWLAGERAVRGLGRPHGLRTLRGVQEASPVRGNGHLKRASGGSAGLYAPYGL